MERIETILNYWFSGLNDAKPIDTSLPQFQRWFGKDEAIDREIQKLYEKDILQAARGEYKDWEKTPKGRLALVILLDQFPRNMYRETPRAFETDSLALAVSMESTRDGHDETLYLIERMFLYMPMMHAESLKIQERSVHYFSVLVEQARVRNPTNVDFFSYSYDYAVKHHTIIKRFGRYPHRNSILGRKSTPEEVEFLKGPDSSF